MAPRYQAPGGQEMGPNPTDRGKLGSKRHIVVYARGIPLVILVSGANRHDSKMFERCVDANPAIAGLAGRPRKRPAKLRADKDYDYQLRYRGIASRIGRRGDRTWRAAGPALLGGGADAQMVCKFWQAENPL